MAGACITGLMPRMLLSATPENAPAQPQYTGMSGDERASDDIAYNATTPARETRWGDSWTLHDNSFP